MLTKGSQKRLSGDVKQLQRDRKETQNKFRGTHAHTTKHNTTAKLQTSTVKRHKMATKSLVEPLSRGFGGPLDVCAQGPVVS